MLASVIVCSLNVVSWCAWLSHFWSVLKRQRSACEMQSSKPPGWFKARVLAIEIYFHTMDRYETPSLHTAIEMLRGRPG